MAPQYSRTRANLAGKCCALPCASAVTLRSLHGKAVSRSCHDGSIFATVVSDVLLSG